MFRKLNVSRSTSRKRIFVAIKEKQILAFVLRNILFFEEKSYFT